MKTKTFYCVILIICVMMLCDFSPVHAAEHLKAGDYVQFGRYLNEPIIWRVIHVDETGPLLFAENILTFKQLTFYSYYSFDNTYLKKYPNLATNQ